MTWQRIGTRASIVFALLLLLPALACSSTAAPAASATTPSNIQAIADPIIENILLCLNNHDYAGFSRDFGQAAKKAIPQTVFEQLYAQAQTTIGVYQTKLYVTANNQNGANSVLYIAKFSKEPAGVSAIVTLQAANSAYQVQGFSLDSPILRGQPLDVSRARSYADSETENVLTTLSNHDYAGFSKDLDQIMKNALPQGDFEKLYAQNKSALGDYQSKEFESALTQNNIITVRYLAKYSAEPAGVWVTISFNPDSKVAGLYFDSPNLRQALSR